MKEFESVEDMVKAAKKRAMFLLQKQDRTKKQLYDKLKDDDYPESVIHAALNYVESYHYIDDYRFACQYIRYKQNSKSARQLSQELMQKGVDRELIEEAIQEEYTVNDRDKIMQLLEKKKYDSSSKDYKEKNRIIAFLMRRGFDAEDIRYCMNEYEID